MEPDQKPKHKEHLNKLSKKSNLERNLLGHESIVPYLSMKASPTHAVSVNIKFINYFGDFGIDSFLMAS